VAIFATPTIGRRADVNRAKWSLSLVREYNRVADSNLRRYVEADPRSAYRTARRVSAPAVALLTFAYTEPPLRSSAVQALAVVRTYPPRGLERATPGQFKTTSERGLAQVQEQVRRALAGLILKPTVEDPDNPRGYWKTPQPFTATMHCYRSSPYGLGPDFESMRPPWMADVLRAATVLLDAIPWLRYCALCGRLFFKVKRQRVCGRRCGVVSQSRERWRREKKGDPSEHRGRPRTDYAGPIGAAHQGWIREHRSGASSRRRR
jgi:hypothetical protein